MAATATVTFAAQLAAARAAANAAHKALNDAIANVTLTPEFQRLALAERRTEMYATCLRAMADIVDTLPALRAAVADAEATVNPLALRACWKCSGTGEYRAPTSAYRNGKPYCFTCNGTGEGRRK